MHRLRLPLVVAVVLVGACGGSGGAGTPTLPELAAADRAVASSVVDELARRQELSDAELADPTRAAALGPDAERIRISIEDHRMTDAEMQCYAARLVDELGVDRVRARGLDGSTPASDVAFDPADDVALVDAGMCLHDWKRLLFKYQTEGTDLIGDQSLQCMADAVTDDEARTMAIAFARFTPGPTLDAAIALYGRCLTSEELSRLDWD